MEFQTPEDTTRDQLANALTAFNADLNPGIDTTADTFIVRTAPLDNETHVALQAHLAETIPGIQELQFTTIGPTVGDSLKTRSLVALLIASIGIVLYIAMAFRKIPRKYNAWKFGLTAVITLLHDIVITLGVFTVLSHVTSFEVDTLFVTALLTILGYSVNDTIIIFDRIRDNLLMQDSKEEFGVIANRSLVQSLTRSLYTGLSTLIMLLALAIFGSESIRWFVLTLIVGISVGTYSSICVATPLLVYWRKK